MSSLRGGLKGLVGAGPRRDLEPSLASQLLTYALYAAVGVLLAYKLYQCAR